MDRQLDWILTGMRDAGCGPEAIITAERLCGAGHYSELIKHLRKCRCDLMEELHQSQKRVDCLDYVIRQAEKCAVLNSCS